MARCDYCGKEVVLPFRCKYCGGKFCAEHHLPENHECPGLSKALSPDVIKREYEIRYEIRRPGYIAVTPPRQVSVRTAFYPGEVKDLLIAFLAVYAVFAFPYALTLRGAIAIFLATLTAFLLHEVSHKSVAMSLGYRARFTLSHTGLLLTLLSAIPLMPIKIIMPGYVAIYGHYERKSFGLIALAGPLTNIIVCMALLTIPRHPLTAIAIDLNALVALFNLIPLGELDGRKIIAWNPVIWAVCMVASIVLYILA